MTQTDLAIIFGNAAPERRAATKELPWSTIVDEGRVKQADGRTFAFIVERLFDRRATLGQRVTWHVELHHWNSRRKVKDDKLPEVREAILAAFKVRIEDDNIARDAAYWTDRAGVGPGQSDDTVEADAAALVTSKDVEGLRYVDSANREEHSLGLGALSCIVYLTGIHSEREALERLKAGEQLSEHGNPDRHFSLVLEEPTTAAQQHTSPTYLTEAHGTTWSCAKTFNGTGDRSYWVSFAHGPSSKAQPGVVGFYASSPEAAKESLGIAEAAPESPVSPAISNLAALAVAQGFREAAKAYPERSDVIVSAWSKLSTEELSVIGLHLKGFYAAKEA